LARANNKARERALRAMQSETQTSLIRKGEAGLRFSAVTV
jgi:hypothetical protein